MTFKRATPVEDVASQVQEKSHEEPEAIDLGEFDTDHLISSGSTLLNLACSDNPLGAFSKGKIINIIGDPSVGKTLAALTICAEACANSHWDDYKIIYDDAESGNSFDIKTLFGQKLADRLEPPSFDKDGEPDSSDTVQRFHMYLDRLLDDGTPFIYVLDSLDGVTSLEEEAIVKANLLLIEAGKPPKGDYGTAKPKAMSSMFRQINRKIKKTGSILIILSQTRDRLDAGPFQPKKTVAGGKALEFYSAHRIWLDKMEKIEKHNRRIGTETRARVTKNKLTGKLREVEFNIYYDYGIDDIGSCIRFLIEEGVFAPPSKKKGEKQEDEEPSTGKKKKLPKAVVATGLGYDQPMSVDQLVMAVDKFKLKPQLIQIVQETWAKIEEDCKLGREPKYA